MRKCLGMQGYRDGFGLDRKRAVIGAPDNPILRTCCVVLAYFVKARGFIFILWVFFF